MRLFSEKDFDFVSKVEEFQPKERYVSGKEFAQRDSEEYARLIDEKTDERVEIEKATENEISVLIDVGEEYLFNVRGDVGAKKFLTALEAKFLEPIGVDVWKRN